MTTLDIGKPVLVTGASGFIGRHLVDSMLAMNRRVIVLCRPSSRTPDAWGGRVDRVDCKDWTLSGLEEAIGARNFGALYHLAAYGVHPNERDRRKMSQINVQCPGHLVRLSRAHNAFMVMAGSSAEYREPASRVPIAETSALEEHKLYGASKAQGALKACALASKLGVRFGVMRLFNVFGAGEAPHRLLPQLVAGLQSGKRIALSPGNQVRDFVYVDDAVEAFHAASTYLRSRSEPVTAIWNVGTGVGHSVREFSELVARALGKDVELLGFGDQAMRADEVPWLVSDSSRIRSDIGWIARYDLLGGIDAAVSLIAKSQRPARTVQ